MRIALLTNYIPPHRLPLFKVLATRTKALKVFLSTPMEPHRTWKPNWEGLNVALQKSWMFTGNWRHPLGFDERVFVHIPYDTLPQLWRYRPNIVISNEMGMRTVFATLYARLHRVPLIIWLNVSDHTEQGRGILRHLLRKWLFRRADAVLVNGEGGARYTQRFGVPAERLFLAPYTADLDTLQPIPFHRPPQQARRLLYVGRLVPLKGLLPFLKVLRRWAAQHPETPVEFWLAGQGPLEEEIRTFDLPTNITLTLLGQVPYEKLPEVYEQAGLLVFPTLADEWGLVVNEAMGTGVPVLGSVYGQAVEELVEDGKNGWSFHPDQPEEMYQALDRALTTPLADLEQMRCRARETSFGLNPDGVAENILQAIDYVS